MLTTLSCVAMGSAMLATVHQSARARVREYAARSTRPAGVPGAGHVSATTARRRQADALMKSRVTVVTKQPDGTRRTTQTGSHKLLR